MVRGKMVNAERAGRGRGYGGPELQTNILKDKRQDIKDRVRVRVRVYVQIWGI
jgi:hypothetical protein